MACRCPIEMMMMRSLQAILLIIIFCTRAFDCFAFLAYPINGGCSTAATTVCNYANSNYASSGTPSVSPAAAEQRKKQRHIPRRAMPHITTSSRAEAATKAGYIIRSEQTSTDDRLRSNSGGEERRPLRTIRRIVHRSNKNNLQSSMSDLEKTLVQEKKLT